MSKVYREGRMEFLKENPNASEIETVEAGISTVIKAHEAEVIRLKSENKFLRDAGALVEANFQHAEDELARLQELYDAGLKMWNPVYESVLNERDRLREALQSILDQEHLLVEDDAYTPTYSIARRALEAK